MTTQRDTACRNRKVLEVLKNKPGPRKGAELMETYYAQYFTESAQGGQGSKRHFVDVAAFLLFAVQERGH